MWVYVCMKSMLCALNKQSERLTNHTEQIEVSYILVYLPYLNLQVLVLRNFVCFFIFLLGFVWVAHYNGFIRIRVAFALAVTLQMIHCSTKKNMDQVKWGQAQKIDIKTWLKCALCIRRVATLFLHQYRSSFYLATIFFVVHHFAAFFSHSVENNDNFSRRKFQWDNLSAIHAQRTRGATTVVVSNDPLIHTTANRLIWMHTAYQTRFTCIT